MVEAAAASAYGLEPSPGAMGPARVATSCVPSHEAGDR